MSAEIKVMDDRTEEYKLTDEATVEVGLEPNQVDTKLRNANSDLFSQAEGKPDIKTKNEAKSPTMLNSSNEIFVENSIEDPTSPQALPKDSIDKAERPDDNASQESQPIQGK